jgi:acyl carrier protein
MIVPTDIIRFVYGAIDDVNGFLPADQKLVKAADTVLVGDGAGLDSLGLVTFLVTIENAFSSHAGISLGLPLVAADPEALQSMKTVGDLIALIETKVAR